jgi:putative SOS response-associated peptidase YedK
MCGRYVYRKIDLRRYGMPDVGPSFDEFSERPRFNVAPRQFMPIVGVNSAGVRSVKLARWGLVPSWVKGKPKAEPINARCETAATSAMFRQAIARRRCLVPADGFFEWQGSKPPKQPYFIHLRSDEPFAFGGVWERWRAEKNADLLDTFTILTTSPNELMNPIHNRMPVIIARSDYDRWLDRTIEAEGIADLLRPYPAEEMEAHAVGTRVNNVKNDAVDLLDPQLA